ncbi:AAA family ATPase [Thorsellia kenyensis]|uniref:AAA family ATPase n=1 Tax=Thorsellia kenyensis TaxID=1549888 RepID=A0ABV6CA59_9GAMM
MDLIEDRNQAAIYFSAHPYPFNEIIKHIPNELNEIDFNYWLNVYPELNEGKTTDQDSIYHAEGNVWIHTQMVVEQMVESKDYKDASKEGKLILFLSALLHDIAKPKTTVIDEKTGRISHPNHSPMGAIMARQLLWFQGTPFAIREEIAQLIFNHQKPYYLLVQKNPEHLITKISYEVNFHFLLVLANADTKGRINPDIPITLKRLKKLRKLAIELQCIDKPRFTNCGVARRKYAYDKITPLTVEQNEPKGSHIHLLVGLPASGKNYWVEKNYPHQPVVSFDDALIELGLKYGEDHKAVAQHTFNKADYLLKSGTDFIWNATNLRKSARLKLLERCYKYDAKVTIVYIECEPILLGQRNNSRKDNTYVPLEAMQRKINYWEVPQVWEADEIKYVINQ